MNRKSIKDIKGVITREKRFSTLAKIEGDGAKKRMKRERATGKIEMSKDSEREMLLDYMWSRKRRKWVTVEEHKLAEAKKYD